MAEGVHPVVSLVFDASKTMVPVVTGFAVLFAGSLGKLWQMGQANGRSTIAWWRASIAVALTLLSLGFFAGAMALAMGFQAGGPTPLLFIFPIPKDCALIWARHFVGLGYMIFVVSIGATAWFWYRTVKRDKS